MKCRYIFGVVCKLRIRPPIVPIEIDGRSYRPLVESKTHALRAIEVTVKVDDPKQWPTILAGEASGGPKASIVPTFPFLPDIERDLRTIEALMSVYGVDAIELEFPTLNWEAESDDERAKLDLYGFGIGRYQKPPSEFLAIPFSAFAQAVLGVKHGSEHEVALSFSRKGNRDFVERRYIEAIYNLYFMLEALFANGKFRKADVIAEFIKSAELRKAIDDVMKSPKPFEGFAAGSHLADLFDRRYRSLSTEQIIRLIVDLRGELHHQSPRRPGAWKPDRNKPYECDAMFLRVVTFKIALDLAHEATYHPDVLAAYEQLRAKYRAKRPAADG